MRFLKTLVLKLMTMLIIVSLLGAAMRYARPMLMKSAGLPEEMPTGGGNLGKPHFSSEESDLMGTVFKSAIRLLTGSASRKELAGELSNKLYAGRADAATMNELGIELVQPVGGGSPTLPGEPPKPGTNPAASSAPGVARTAAKSAATTTAVLSSAHPAGGLQNVFLARLQRKAMANPELALAPVVLTGMLVAHGVRRRRRNPLDDLVLTDMASLLPSDSEPYEMTHAVHKLRAEDFELLVALIYQRQGYRVTMPAGLSGGHGIDFTLQRKSERLLVQCKNMRQDFRLPIERMQELHKAVTVAGATRGLFVASCGYSWDARNFAKGKGMTVINARTLDALITEAREDEGEDLLAVAEWAPKFMAKVKLTPPVCPTCEAEMEWTSAGGGTVWVCSQRPDCRGRRTARKYQAAVQSAVQARPTTLAKITKSVQFTQLTRLIRSMPSPVPGKLAETARPVAPVKPAAPAKAVAAVKPVVAAKRAALAKPAVPAEAAVPTQPVKPAKAAAFAAAAAAKPVAPTKVDLPTAPATPVKSAKSAASAKLAKLVAVVKPGASAMSGGEEKLELPPPAKLYEVFPNLNRPNAESREESPVPPVSIFSRKT